MGSIARRTAAALLFALSLYLVPGGSLAAPVSNLSSAPLLVSGKKPVEAPSGWIEDAGDEESEKGGKKGEDGKEGEETGAESASSSSQGEAGTGTGAGSSDGDVTSPTVEKSGGRTMLKLGVRHSERLDGVPDGLRPGDLFDEHVLMEDADSPTFEWYPIPVWLAGRWRRSNEVTVYSLNYANGVEIVARRPFMSEQIADFGAQIDSKGGIWNCNLASMGRSDRGSYYSVARVVSQKPVINNGREMVFREVFTVVNVNKQNGVVLDSCKTESLTRYRPRPDGSLETYMSIKSYNSDGTPRSLQENVSIDRRIAPLVAVDEYKGKDVKGDFERFLREKGLKRLIPNR